MSSTNSKLISYSMDFASFLIQKIKNKSDIKNIILFGSVAREEAENDSDVDIFIDLVREGKNQTYEIGNILKKFLDSAKYNNYWKVIGINNEIKLKIGELDKWKELKPSIISNGILLYGKFKTGVQGEPKTFFVWENIKPNAKRVLFNKQMFGYKKEKKFYEGLIQKYKGARLGKGCIIVPANNSNEFHQLFKKHNITVKIKKVIDYS